MALPAEAAHLGSGTSPQVDLWLAMLWAGRSKDLVVGVGAAIHASRCYSILPMSSSSPDQSAMTSRHAEGSLIEIPPLLRGGGVFGFFFFFIGYAQADCFPRDGCRRLGVSSTTSSDEEDELLSEGGPARAWVAWASMPFGQVPSSKSKTYTARSYPQVFKKTFQHEQDLTLQGLPTLPHVVQFDVT